MNNDFFTVGLSGQTGSGKSSAAAYFKENGFYVIDCDKVARDVTSDGSRCCRELKSCFPGCVDDDLHLDRKALGNIVFNSAEKLEKLNELIFPFILVRISEIINSAVTGGSHYIMLDAPTLFDSGAHKLCDLVVSCVADEETRCKRIMERDSLTREQAMSRIKAQKTEEFFRTHSDMIIECCGKYDSLSRAAGFLSKIIKEKLYGGKIEKEKEEKR